MPCLRCVLKEREPVAGSLGLELNREVCLEVDVCLKPLAYRDCKGRLEGRSPTEGASRRHERDTEGRALGSPQLRISE